ncbi:MAG: hypothetical protein ABSA63_04570 [Thermoplasmata archaeon]|jgi:hypothetical protein
MAPMKAKAILSTIGAVGAATILLAVIVLLPAASAEVVATSSITANFNADTIPSGDVIWFSSVIQWVGTSPTVTTNVHFVHQTLTFTEPSGLVIAKAIWSSVTTFSTSATTAATIWEAGAYAWSTFAPAQYKGDTFLSGFAYFVPSGGIPGSTQVTWSGTFETSGKCFDLNWKWAAAVYTTFPKTNVHPPLNSGIGVKPVDDNKLSMYSNGDHAGTPENYTAYLTPGATGGGGSDFTGSYSGTVGVNTCSGPPP